MSRKEIMNKLKDILLSTDGIDVDTIKQADENTELFSGLGLSSFKLLYVAITIEEEFDIIFKDLDLCDLFRIKDVIDYISSQAR